MNVSLIVIRCADLEASKDFYSNFGLKFTLEKHGNGPKHYASEVNGIVFELYPSNGEACKDNTRLGFKLPELKSGLSRLTVVSTYEFNGQSVFVVQDPDGRKVELSE